MKKLQTKTKKAKSFFFSLAVGLVFLGVLFGGTRYVDHMSRMQNVDLIRQAVRRAAVQCYSIEGMYPSEVEYLEDNYGITIDNEKFFVDYSCMASNIMPEIEVYERE